MEPQTVASLFQPEPFRWGLRGDPHLWREMRAGFQETPLPGTAEGIDVLIEAAFHALTGHATSESEPFFVARFDHGGISSGHVSPGFWRDLALPLLRTRFLEAAARDPRERRQ